jgi:O-antigen biosynthesis protein
VISPFIVDDPVVDAEVAQEALATMPRRPLLSIIVPAYQTRRRFLEACIRSVEAQFYSSWELIIVDDGSHSPDVSEVIAAAAARDERVKPVRREKNGNVSRATNDGLQLAMGEFVLFVDHDDELLPDALLRFAEAVIRAPEMDVWYSDQAICDEDGRIIGYLFKPDWSPVYFLGVSYVGHLLGVRRSIAGSVGGFDADYDGVQDFEFLLRISERTQRIGHIRHALYKWRANAGSTIAGSGAEAAVEARQMRAAKAHLARIRRTWSVEPHSRLPNRFVITMDERTPMPPVSIIIPSRDLGDVVERCLSSIFALTDYPEFEIIIMDNGTVDPVALAAFRRFPVKVVPFVEKFNYSRANNLGVQNASHDLLIFLNNDTEVFERSWLRDLVLYLEDPGVGAVGPLLLYPDRRVQHAGIVLGCQGTADHVMRFFPDQADGYSGSLSCSREVTAVTGACLLMRKDLFAMIGGFSEDFATHYQDVDLCLKIRQAGYRIICSARPGLVHYEGLTREQAGYDFIDRAILVDRWNEQIQKPDPYYNPHLDLERLDYSVSR